jgi:DNA invertase Pin-like site-specific DNA recombinase
METSAPKDLRLIGYVRVSRVGGRAGDSFISPAQQRDRITAWAAAYGHQLVDVHEELDESGARVDRPKLLAAIKAIEDGQADGIVVAKLDRFGRSLVDGLQLIDRIHKAGGTFVSVADGFDLTTDTGRLVLRIMLTLAEFELDRVRGNWHDAKARAVARGIHVSAQAPFGSEERRLSRRRVRGRAAQRGGARAADRPSHVPQVAAARRPARAQRRPEPHPQPAPMRGLPVHRPGRPAQLRARARLDLHVPQPRRVEEQPAMRRAGQHQGTGRGRADVHRGPIPRRGR